MGNETRVVSRVVQGIPTPSVLISPKLGSLSAHRGPRSAVSNSLDRYLPSRHEEPGLAVVGVCGIRGMGCEGSGLEVYTR
jgi:hypothetical protein